MIPVSVSFMSLCQQIACCLPQARCLCSENVAIGFKTSMEDYFVEQTVLGHRSQIMSTFERNILNKIVEI